MAHHGESVILNLSGHTRNIRETSNNGKEKSSRSFISDEYLSYSRRSERVFKIQNAALVITGLRSV